jgi:hypothetical protein
MRMLRPDGVVKVMKVVAASQLAFSTTPISVPRGSGATTAGSCSPPSVLLAPFVEEYLASFCYNSLSEFVHRNKHSVNGTFQYFLFVALH